MSGSDSELSSAPAIPSDASLEKALRDAVAKLFKDGDRENLTVKRVRTSAEKALDLPEGFFKGDAKWKAESDTIIRSEAEKQEAMQDGSQKTEESPVKPKAKPKPEAKPKSQKKSAKPPKRASPDEPSKPAKRQKKAPIDESEDELSSPPSDASEKKPKKKAKAVKPPAKTIRAKAMPKLTKEEKIVDSDRDEEPAPKKPKDEDESSSEKAFETPEKTDGAAKTADSESELSEVLDPAPKPKRQKRKSSEPSVKPDKKAGKPTKAKDDSNLNSDETEIKKLQGWLIKCGIRKMWFRELAPYDTPRGKIQHLRGMLKDAGMDGRFSNEKAAQIKEERELKADLDMVKEGAKRWGADSDNSDVDEKGKPRRRLARGLRDVTDLLGSDDGEETS